MSAFGAQLYCCLCQVLEEDRRESLSSLPRAPDARSVYR